MPLYIGGGRLKGEENGEEGEIKAFFEEEEDKDEEEVEEGEKVTEEKGKEVRDRKIKKKNKRKINQEIGLKQKALWKMR